MTMKRALTLAGIAGFLAGLGWLALSAAVILVTTAIVDGWSWWWPVGSAFLSGVMAGGSARLQWLALDEASS